MFIDYFFAAFFFGEALRFFTPPLAFFFEPADFFGEPAFLAPADFFFGDRFFLAGVAATGAKISTANVRIINCGGANFRSQVVLYKC